MKRQRKKTDRLLDEICNNCGRTVRKHCYARECRYFLRWCPQYFVRKTDDWPDGSFVGHNCLKCMKPIVSHYDSQPFSIMVMGTTITDRMETVYLWPSWIGCPAELPMPSDSLHC